MSQIDFGKSWYGFSFMSFCNVTETHILYSHLILIHELLDHFKILRANNVRTTHTLFAFLVKIKDYIFQIKLNKKRMKSFVPSNTHSWYTPSKVDFATKNKKSVKPSYSQNDISNNTNNQNWELSHFQPDQPGFILAHIIFLFYLPYESHRFAFYWFL